MASTIKAVPKKQTEDEVQQLRVGQGRRVLHRYRLQVDRQTKSSFAPTRPAYRWNKESAAATSEDRSGPDSERGRRHQPWWFDAL